MLSNVNITAVMGVMTADKVIEKILIFKWRSQFKLHQYMDSTP